MSRSVQDVRVARGVDEVRNYIAAWFNSNDFKVLEWQATGNPITHWHMGARWKLSPRAGCIVALSPTAMSNAVAIELTLAPEGPGTLVHGEFYVPPTGTVAILTKEMDVAEDAVNAMIPRRRGHKLMMSLVQGLNQLSGAPPMAMGSPQSMPMQAQPGGQPPMAYPAGGPPGPQPMMPPPPQPSSQQSPQPPYPQAQAQAQAPAQWPQPGAPQAAPTQPQPGAQVQSQQTAVPQVFFCMYCGTQLTAPARFCVRCGKPAVPPEP